jgi:hypothetical protein
MGMKVFSFSLFGNDPIYTIGTIKNVDIIKDLFPEWGVFIYTDKDESNGIIQELIKKGCVIRYESNQNWFNSTWRFKAITEDNVSVMVCRDSDSRISTRDVAAIDEWLESDYDYNIIRDHPIGHHWKMNAGMWGAKKTEFILDINNKLQRYHQNNTTLTGHKNFDQFFLRDVIYPNIVDNSLIHDEYYKYESNAKPINHDRKSNDFKFIGESIDENDKPRGDQRREIKQIYKQKYEV